MYATVWDNRECARGRVRPQRSRKPRHHCRITARPRRHRAASAEPPLSRRRPRRFPRFRMPRRVSSVKVQCARPFVTSAPGRPGAHATNGRSCCEARALRMLRRVSSAAPGVAARLSPAAIHPVPPTTLRRRLMAGETRSWREKLPRGRRSILVAAGATRSWREQLEVWREKLTRGGSNYSRQVRRSPANSSDAASARPLSGLRRLPSTH